MRRDTYIAPRPRRRRRARRVTAARAGIAATVILALGLAVLARITFKRYRFDVRPAARGAAPVNARPALPAYPVTAAADAARGCYGPGETGVAVLDTVATAPGVAVVTVAAARDRATLAYVEARQAAPVIAACLGRVVSGDEGWSGYVRRVDPAIGIVDHVIVDSAGRGAAFARRRVAATAVDRAAHAAGPGARYRELEPQHAP